MLPVLRSLEFSSAYISILDCTPSPTLFALASHNRVECSSRLEHSTVYDLAHSSFADGTNHAARFVVVGIIKCAHQHLGLWHQPCCSFCGRRNFQVRTSISWTVHFLTLYALYRLTIAFSSARDWNILRCVILRIFHLLMALSMLLV